MFQTLLRADASFNARTHARDLDFLGVIRTMIKRVSAVLILGILCVVTACGRQPNRTPIEFLTPDPKEKVPEKPGTRNEEVLLQTERLSQFLTIAARQIESTLVVSQMQSKKENCMRAISVPPKNYTSYRWIDCSMESNVFAGNQSFNPASGALSLDLRFKPAPNGPLKLLPLKVQSLIKDVKDLDRNPVVGTIKSSFVLNDKSDKIGFDISATNAQFTIDAKKVKLISFDEIAIGVSLTSKGQLLFKPNAALSVDAQTGLVTGSLDVTGEIQGESLPKNLTVVIESNGIRYSEGGNKREWACQGICVLPLKNAAYKFYYP